MAEVDPADLERYGGEAINRVLELAPGESIRWADAVNATRLMSEFYEETTDG